jgi:hypothetical protein
MLCITFGVTYVEKLMHTGIVKIIFAPSLSAALSELALVTTPSFPIYSMKHLRKDDYE